MLTARMAEDRQPAVARVQAGRALARLGDPRPGVGAGVDGLPDIAWCEAPAGSFRMGSSETDETANEDEKPQREVYLPAFCIARYPITNAQYAAFVRDGGYTERWRRFWILRFGGRSPGGCWAAIAPCGCCWRAGRSGGCSA